MIRMPLLRLVDRTILVAAITLLAACGGGGGDTGRASEPPPAAAPAPTISGFAPAQAAAGETVRVQGAALSSTTRVRLGTIEAAFVVESAQQLRFTVPQGAVSGRIELTGSGSVALSAAELQVRAPALPTVASVTPDTVIAPARVTLAGSALDAVTDVRLNGVPLAIAARSATTLQLDVPAAARSGNLALATAAGPVPGAGPQLTVLAPMSIAGFAPAQVARGGSLTISGAQLDRATAVEFTGGARADISARSGSTSITVLVPGAAASGAIALIGPFNERVASSDVLTVLAPIVVDAQATYRIARVAQAVTIAGSGLSAVTAVTVGSNAASITNRSDSALSFTVPAGTLCAPITLLSATQPAVAAGSVVVGDGCALRVAGVEVAQSLSQAASDPLQRLVPGKSALVRAYLVAESSGNAAPVVRVSATAAGRVLGTLTMTGPATVPQLVAGSALPASLRNDETRSWNATLPAAWVVSGLALRVDAGLPAATDITPRIGSSTRIDLVLVPLVSGSNAPTMPSAQEVADELVRRLPLGRDAVRVSIRAPYTLNATSDGVDSGTEWSNVLSELEGLRSREAPDKHYYGFVRPMVSAGTAGIGYVNRSGSRGLLSSLGWDASRGSWRRTMVHELGHNFSRSHAPCGGVSSSDPNYPYAGGLLSATPLFDSIAVDIISPANLADVMGYCSGTWFSDYNYRAIQAFMEAQPQATAMAVEGAAAEDVLRVTGRIDAQGVHFEPVMRVTRGRALGASSAVSRHSLQVRGADGSAFDLPVEAVAVDHADELHFIADLPAALQPQQLELRHDGRALPLAGGGRATAMSARTERAAAPAIRWQERGGRLELQWDVAATVAVDAALLEGGRRHVLGLTLRGGSASLDLAALPHGGQFEFSLSSGLSAVRVVVPR
jgi:trimeric autotransporter adhesin